MRKMIFGFLILIVFGSCQTEPKSKQGRYCPIGDNVLDTETGMVYLIPTRLKGFAYDDVCEVHLDGDVVRKKLLFKRYEKSN
jgi:hypothetical protein